MERTVVGFLTRLERLGTLLVAVAPERQGLLVELRPAGRRVLVDLEAEPPRVRVGGVHLEGAVTLAASPEDLHATLLGVLPPTDGLGDRRLLLAGSMRDIARWLPVLALAPPLYAQHLRRARGETRLGDTLASAALRAAALPAVRAGRLLGRLDRRELLDALLALARGAAEACPEATVPPAVDRSARRPNPLDSPLPSPSRAAALAALGRAMQASGRAAGEAVFRAGLDLDLVELLGMVGDGIGVGRAEGAAHG